MFYQYTLDPHTTFLSGGIFVFVLSLKANRDFFPCDPPSPVLIVF